MAFVNTYSATFENLSSVLTKVVQDTHPELRVEMVECLIAALQAETPTLPKGGKCPCGHHFTDDYSEALMLDARGRTRDLMHHDGEWFTPVCEDDFDSRALIVCPDCNLMYMLPQCVYIRSNR